MKTWSKQNAASEDCPLEAFAKRRFLCHRQSQPRIRHWAFGQKGHQKIPSLASRLPLTSKFFDECGIVFFGSPFGLFRLFVHFFEKSDIASATENNVVCFRYCNVLLFANFRYGFCRCNLLADFRYKDYALEDPFFALWIRRSKQQAEIGLSPVGK